MAILLSTLTIIILGLYGIHCNEVCSFNRLCTCRRSHHEVICRGVPFSAFPNLPTETIYQVTMIRTGLEVLPSKSFEGTSVASLHLMQNNIIILSPGAFNGLENILTTLDLSHNQLRQFPLSVLSHLNNLQWLNLQGNHIEDIHGVKWSHLNSRVTLNTLFLGSNYIASIQEGAFVKLINLNVLDLDGNFIHDVGSHCFPHSLRSLSLANNILKKVPLHSIYALKNLRFLDISGNLFHRLPCPFHLHVTHLDKMDLSNNLLTHITECVFNGSFTIKELHLDFNFIRSLSARSFKGTKLERLMLANNRISNIHSDAFAGLETTLTTLDLSFNLMEQFPTAVNDLNALLYLSLKSNLLKGLGRGDLHGSRNSLEILDLSGNMLQHVPKNTLKPLTKLMRLSLQDNRIQKVYRDDFEGWGQSLTTLSLANNKMTYLSGGAFAHLTKLKELKLSFNNLMYLDQNVFSPLRKTLEVLDLSSAFSQSNHPLELFISSLSHLEWLQLDHNNISRLSSTSVNALSKLRHLDISNNEMVDISPDFFVASKHTYLSAVHISNNDLKLIESGTFDNILHLSTVVLFGNKISNIESYSFNNCKYLHTLVISNNELVSIGSSAFSNLTRLSNLFLQDNRLESFSFEMIQGETPPLYLNLSNNAIKYLANVNDSMPTYAKVRILDLTCNQISVIPDCFFETISRYLLHLFLSNNFISALPPVELSSLQVLHLSFNDFRSLNSSDLVCCPNVQILKLDHNNISYVDADTFRHMKHLRILDLSYNAISEVDENIFSSTSLERLNFSKNYFTQTPTRSLASVRDTLRHLDLSLNLIENISVDSFSRLNKLQALNLSSNHISFLHEKSFHHLNNLLELDLSHNPLKAIANDEPFSSLTTLSSLHMRNTSLISITSLPLPQLKYLDLKDNYIYNLSQEVFSITDHIHYLDLSGNLLQDVPLHLWRKTKKLVSLDISRNPVEVLGVNSFSGLEKLQHLDISGLLLKRLDPRTLYNLKFLITVKTDSYASVRSFRLQDLLSQAPALRKVTINVEESTLSHQVQGAFGTKLRELVITGLNLQRILPDAFSGLSTHELTIRICGTTVNKFPDGLLRYLPDVRYLTLDLRNNQLATMGPGVLAAIARDGPDVLQTQHISGGVLLEDNPWNCSCELLWLGRWLRRWLRETFHVHMLNVEAALYVNSVSRKATCSVTGTNISLAIVELRSTDVDCEVKVNRSSHLLINYVNPLIVVMVALSSSYFYFAQIWTELNTYLIR
ncbi:chaoptin-like [Uloborus diversus]|uniref:chaoptin-like n=1 Tax=Uloborus diversus TaxID=327109 RepID=UPI0024094B39|nr:chaoptin-like [Uloborus diversus]